jgi:uncharacterized protein
MPTNWMRTDVEFASGDALCRGWFYRPSPPTQTACIVMAHGLGGTRDTGLEPYAERFAAEGYAVLLFDYRGFGASEGVPRQVVSIGGQLQDWKAAIAFARAAEQVDPARIALWGSSFSGGHVVQSAVTDGRIAAVVAQCPMMDGFASSLAVVKYAGLMQGMRVVAHGVWDLCAALFGSAHLIPLVAPPGHVAAMSSADAEQGLRALQPPGFVNAVGARIAITLATYRPGRKAGALSCPLLVQVCEHDSVAPAAAAEAAARRAGQRAIVLRYPIGHFEPYVGEAFEQSVRDQLVFFRNQLGRATGQGEHTGVRDPSA